MIKFKYELPAKHGSAIKATIHKSTGRLGFSSSAALLMNLENNRYFKFAINQENEEDKNFYLVCSDEDDKTAFKINKAGDYYFLKLKHVFDKYKLDYKTNTVEFDIVENDGQFKYYTLKPKIKHDKKTLSAN